MLLNVNEQHHLTSVGEAILQAKLVKLEVVQPGSSLNKLHFYPRRNVVCKTTAKKNSFSNYLYSLYSFNLALNKSTYGVYETKYNSLQKIHMPAEICLSTREEKV